MHISLFVFFLSQAHTHTHSHAHTHIPTEKAQKAREKAEARHFSYIASQTAADAVEAAQGSVETAFFYVKLLKGKADAQSFAVRSAQTAAEQAKIYAGAYFSFFLSLPLIVAHTITH